MNTLSTAVIHNDKQEEENENRHNNQTSSSNGVIANSLDGQLFVCF